jgi:heat-inducible transcription repressor hrcA
MSANNRVGGGIVLNERKKKILQIIIEDYISSAEPVGSRTIARKYDLGLSPATIRNEMSDLELLGYLEQPHTSAGRIPSAQAYRFYVDALIEPGTLTDNDMALIDGWYNERRRNIDDIFQSTAKILSRMTQNVSMVLTNQQTIANFCYLKFLPLDSQHAILCIVADDGSIDTNVVDIPLGMSSEEMDYLAGKMSKLLEDRNLSDISVEILQNVHTDVVEDKLIFSSLLQAVRKMTGRRQEQKVFLGGTKQLLNQPEFRDVERVRNLLGILEEEKVLKDLLQGGEDSGLKVTIGSENKFTGIQDCSMVQATYRLNGQIVGTMAVAVLGPTRMEYGKVISVMDYLHKYLKTILDK